MNEPTAPSPPTVLIQGQGPALHPDGTLLTPLGPHSTYVRPVHGQGTGLIGEVTVEGTGVNTTRPELEHRRAGN